MKDFFKSIRIWRFWLYDAWLDQALRHRMSVLGLFWSLIPVIVFVGLIGAVFRHVNDAEVNFYLYLLVGFVIWTPVSHILSSAGRCYNANRSFVMVGGLPLLSFNLKLTVQAVFYFLMQATLIPLAWLIFRPTLSSELLFVVPAVLMLFTLLFATSIVAALIGARSEDFSEALKSIQRILFLATPIIWSVSADPERLGLIKPLLFVNPFFYAVELIRAPLIGAPINHAYWLPLAGFTLASLVVAGYFHRLMARETPLWL